MGNFLHFWSHLHIFHIRHHIVTLYVQSFAMSFVQIICLFSKWCNWFWFCPYPLPFWVGTVTLLWFIKMQRRLRQERWHICKLGKKSEFFQNRWQLKQGKSTIRETHGSPKSPKVSQLLTVPFLSFFVLFANGNMVTAHSNFVLIRKGIVMGAPMGPSPTRWPVPAG